MHNVHVIFVNRNNFIEKKAICEHVHLRCTKQERELKLSKTGKNLNEQ